MINDLGMMIAWFDWRGQVIETHSHCRGGVAEDGVILEASVERLKNLEVEAPFVFPSLDASSRFYRDSSMTTSGVIND